jgi:hypothetical protein
MSTKLKQASSSKLNESGFSLGFSIFLIAIVVTICLVGLAIRHHRSSHKTVAIFEPTTFAQCAYAGGNITGVMAQGFPFDEEADTLVCDY